MDREPMTSVLAVAGLVVGWCALRALIRAGPGQVFCRACLLAGVWAWAVPLAVGAALLPAVWIVAAVVLFVFFRGRSGGGLWAKGTARWAEYQELLGQLQRTDGLLLGRIPAAGFRESVRLLWKAPLALSEAACRLFLSRGNVWVSATKGTHSVTVAPAGKGKSTCLVIPHLLTCRDSIVCVDIKGELFAASAAARRRMGQRVYVLDPWGVTGAKSDTLNVFDLIDPKGDRNALDLIRAIAEALVVRTGEEKEPHWNDGAEMFIAAVIALVAAHAKTRNLQEVADILASPEDLARAKLAMASSDAYGGLLARMGDQLKHFVERELGSTLTTVARHLRFLSSIPVAENTKASTFDPRELVRVPTTIYLVMPPDKLGVQNGLLRQWINTWLRVLIQSGLTRGRKIRFVLDEAAALGKMSAIEDAITQLRGYGLSLSFYFQSMGQLTKVYGEGQEQTFMSNMDTRIFFGVNDNETAKYVSEALGKTTVSVLSRSAGGSTTYNADPFGAQSSSSTANDGVNENQDERDLLQAAEVQRLDDDQAIVFMPEVPPTMVTLCPYYSVAWKSRPNRRGIGLKCLLFAVASAVLAACATVAMGERWEHGRGPVKTEVKPQTKEVKQQPLKAKSPGLDWFIEKNRAEVERLRKK